MRSKIALEEHFGTEDPNIVGQSEEHATTETWAEHRRQLLDVQQERLALMDRAGIECSVLSLLSPGIQGLPDRTQARDWARRLNDVAAEQVAAAPTRFAAFAALPLQDPDAAAAELQRCVRELGFVGALVNGFSQADTADSAHYLDTAAYGPFWETVHQLDVPVYLHPRDPLPDQQRAYTGHPWLLGSAWAFSVETATHALRLMASGLFDTYPDLRLILGHLGELLPFNIWRTDHRIAISPRGIPTQQPLAHYLRRNVYVTTSGNFHTPTLLTTLQEMGPDHVLFSADYPFENMLEAAHWFDGLDLDPPLLDQIGRSNARALLNLG